MKTKVLNGTPEELEQLLSDFFKDNDIKVHWITQSQSLDGNEKGAKILVTLTILYTEYDGAHRQVTGFSR